MQQRPFFFGNCTVVSAATAVSILSLIQDADFEPTGSCVSLNVTFGTNVYWGSDSTVTDADGALVTANTPVVDSAVGFASDAIPISQMFVFKAAAGDSDGVIYARFIP